MKRHAVTTIVVGLGCLVAVSACDLLWPTPVADPLSQWLDTFQTYPVAGFPPDNWHKSGNADASGNEVVWDIDTDTTRGHVLELTGVYGGNWSSVAYRAVSLTDLHHIRFRVKTSDVGGVGSHHFNAAVDLMTEPDWTANGRWLIFFGTEGKIRTSLSLTPADGEGLILGDYELGKWYDVEIWYNRDPDGTVGLSYYVDGRSVGRVVLSALSYEESLGYLGLWSGDTKAWFDDVGVSPSGHY